MRRDYWKSEDMKCLLDAAADSGEVNHMLIHVSDYAYFRKFSLDHIDQVSQRSLLKTGLVAWFTTHRIARVPIHTVRNFPPGLVIVTSQDNYLVHQFLGGKIHQGDVQGCEHSECVTELIMKQ